MRKYVDFRWFILLMVLTVISCDDVKSVETPDVKNIEFESNTKNAEIDDIQIKMFEDLDLFRGFDFIKGDDVAVFYYLNKSEYKINEVIIHSKDIRDDKDIVAVIKGTTKPGEESKRFPLLKINAVPQYRNIRDELDKKPYMYLDAFVGEKYVEYIDIRTIAIDYTNPMDGRDYVIFYDDKTKSHRRVPWKDADYSFMGIMDGKRLK